MKKYSIDSLILRKKEVSPKQKHVFEAAEMTKQMTST